MAESLLILFIIIAIIVLINSPKKENGQSQISTINANIISYPEDIKCESCGGDISATMNAIDCATWDLICPSCNRIGYKHPQRDERQKQINDLLDY